MNMNVVSMHLGRTVKKIFWSKFEGSRKKEDLDVEGLKIWRKSCGNESKKMVKEYSLQGRMGVRN